MSSSNKRNHSHHYAAEPIVCVAAYPAEQQHNGLQNLTAVLTAGVLLWFVFCLS
jgi:hypothetical protein